MRDRATGVGDPLDNVVEEQGNHTSVHRAVTADANVVKVTDGIHRVAVRVHIGYLRTKSACGRGASQVFPGRRIIVAHAVPLEQGRGSVEERVHLVNGLRRSLGADQAAVDAADLCKPTGRDEDRQ
ncbi:hypothetical protein [Pseudonocardia oroxyli]|uniref:hypothetical protein n=1 Tax=Pseudonocardia oroxyli TaxID=366584 RepID=UPI00115F82DF|nr:hypothetical protein [Pseudonocardia oroxyli]